MVFSLLLAMSLALSPAAQDSTDPETSELQAAVEAAEEGRNAEALAAFERVAAANPDDHEARLWIARLHARMGDYDLAEPVYRSVLLEDPDNIEARLGVAEALLRRDEPTLAIDMLEAAEEVGANNGDVLAALGRAHRAADHADQAIDYLKRAVSVAPNRRNLLSLEAAREFYLHRIQASAADEQFSDTTPESTLGDLALDIRLTSRWRLLAQGQVQRRFGQTEQRGGAGVEWRFAPATTLRAVALVGPDNRIAPEQDYLGEVRHTQRATTWSATVRYFDFGGTETITFAPAIAWTPESPLSLALGYTASRTDSRTTSAVNGHSAFLRAAVRVYPRISLQGGYASGVEDFDRFSIDRTGDFRAHTFSGGARVYLPTMTAIIGQYEYQTRSRDTKRDMGRVTVSLAQTF